jgi:hypothetical protein
MSETLWSAAVKLGEKHCPYRERKDDGQDVSYTEDCNRMDWCYGFAFGFLGVPEDCVGAEIGSRCFWQGYDAGEQSHVQVHQEKEMPT